MNTLSLNFNLLIFKTHNTKFRKKKVFRFSIDIFLSKDKSVFTKTSQIFAIVTFTSVIYFFSYKLLKLNAYKITFVFVSLAL